MISDYIKKLILDEETHKQLVVVFHGNNEVDFAHAACFVRTHNYFKNRQMLLLDCKNKTPIVCPKRGADQMEFQESLIVKEDIEASYFKWEIFAIERRVVVDEIERLKIHNRMMYVLTGDRQYLKESQSIGGKMTLQKREQRKRKKKGSFYKRPDRSLNEKKKIRASAQKAGMEKPLKAIDDEPMEMDEIRQEVAETALIEDDNQGSDYEIDEYLDDPSKAYILNIHYLYRHPPSRLLRASQALG